MALPHPVSDPVDLEVLSSFWCVQCGASPHSPCFVFFWKFQLHTNCNFNTTAGGTCQKCCTKHCEWGDALHCMSVYVIYMGYTLVATPGVAAPLQGQSKQPSSWYCNQMISVLSQENIDYKGKVRKGNSGRWRKNKEGSNAADSKSKPQSTRSFITILLRWWLL